MLGFVVCSFVRVECVGCGVVGVGVWIGCCELYAGWRLVSVGSSGQLFDNVFNVGVKFSSEGVY